MRSCLLVPKALNESPYAVNAATKCGRADRAPSALQRPLASGDGPIGLIMAPTRELVVQIGKDIRMFTRALDFTCVCAYGGSAVGDQISALKRGAEVGTEALTSRFPKRALR